MEQGEIEEFNEGKELYDYQNDAIDTLFDKMKQHPENYNLLFQLPTGGGKTVIFSEISKRFIQTTGKKVLILTHRIELCAQTSSMLNEFGVDAKVIDSKVKTLPEEDEYQCFVAMVETLNNRLSDEIIKFKNLGLVIVDEAHYNAFRKLFSHFDNCIILGVTATPLSSNITLPMNSNYQDLVVGHSIKELVDMGFLAKATTYSYYADLTSLKVGINGDYTVSSSEVLYSGQVMTEKLLYAYNERAKGKKTLIFNAGIKTSKHVYSLFKKADLDVRHLDNTCNEKERKEVLDWFKNTPNAILTSVGILTTGFDEPTVECIILNRATRSLTLYHQMIGRGSRVLPTKKEFAIIDLGNNVSRFGLWDSYIDWNAIFKDPNRFLESLISDDQLELDYEYVMPDWLKQKFSKSKDLEFDIKAVHIKVVEEGKKSWITIDLAVAQHAKICIENSDDYWEALDLARLLEEIDYRVKKYTYGITKSTKNYIKWLQAEYKKKLEKALKKKFSVFY